MTRPRHRSPARHCPPVRRAAADTKPFQRARPATSRCPQARFISRLASPGWHSFQGVREFPGAPARGVPSHDSRPARPARRRRFSRHPAGDRIYRSRWGRTGQQRVPSLGKKPAPVAARHCHGRHNLLDRTAQSRHRDGAHGVASNRLWWAFPVTAVHPLPPCAAPAAFGGPHRPSFPSTASQPRDSSMIRVRSPRSVRVAVPRRSIQAYASHPFRT